MKITINYGNSASINTGVPYESIKPFYNVSYEMELPDRDMEHREEIVSNLFDKAKYVVDTMLYRDMRYMNEIRKKCNCKLTYDENHKPVHQDHCFMVKNGI